MQVIANTLEQKAVVLSAQLGLDAQLTVAETVAQAVKNLGLEDEVKDLNLVERANKCLQQVLPTAHGAATATTNAAMPVARASTTTAGMPVTYGSQAVPGAPVTVGMQREPGQREETSLVDAPPAAEYPISATMLHRGCPCMCNIGWLRWTPFIAPGFACIGADPSNRSSEDLFTKWQLHGIGPFCVPDLGERWVRLGRSNQFRRTDAKTCGEDDRRYRVYISRYPYVGRCIVSNETAPTGCHYGCRPICD
jgi:hypothetical protein